MTRCAWHLNCSVNSRDAPSEKNSEPKRMIKRNIFAPKGAISFRLSLRGDLHLLRKMWHVTMGSMIAFLYWGGIQRWVGVGMLMTVFLVNIAVETLRLKHPGLNEKVLRFWGPLMRSCEVNRISGVAPYLASAALAIAFFPKAIAILSILFLAVGDPIASLLGVMYGQYGYRFSNGKSALGTLAGVLSCIALAMCFGITQGWAQAASPIGLLAFSLWAGLAGGAAELLPLEMDDNFTIPIVSGLLSWFAALVFNIPL